uniref:Secreted protein n=1 Tax=Junco hyemalis TaxID=40217 RepID=A0A8C5J4N7_JUNHY
MILKTLFSFFSCLTGSSLWFSQAGWLGWCSDCSRRFSASVKAGLRVLGQGSSSDWELHIQGMNLQNPKPFPHLSGCSVH